MLPSFQKAFFVHGPIQKVAANACGVGDRTFYKWSTGRSRCPRSKRESVNRSLSTDALPVFVDWSQYDREFDAVTRPTRDTPPEKPVEQQRSGWGASTSETPETPPQAAEKDALSEVMGL